MAFLTLKFIFFLCLCLFVPSTLAKNVKYCNRKANYPVKVNGLKMTPDPVRAGKEAVFTLSATSAQDISKGEVDISVSYFGIHVHSEKIDLCKETTCPVKSGDFELSHKQKLPVFTPPGAYTLQMKIFDGSNVLLTCINFGFKIALGESAYDI